MTPPVPDRSAPSLTYGPRRPDRPADVTPPPPPRQPQSLPAELSSVREALEAALPEALRQHEARMRVLAQGLVASQQSAELTLAQRSITRLRRAAVTLGLVAGTAAASCATRLLAGHEVTAAAEDLAARTAATAAAELETSHADTRSIATRNTARIDAIEGKLDRVLELLQPPPAPAPAPAPPKGRRR